MIPARTSRLGSSRLRTPLALAAVAVAIGLATATAAATAGPARADDESGIGLSVDLPSATSTPDPTASPTSTPTVTTPSTSSNTTGSSSTVSPSTSAVAPVSTAAVTPGEDTVDLGGKFFVSGLASGSGFSVDPFSGEAVIHITVRNVSKETVNASARFWADGPFGNELSEVKVKIEDLKPDESRVVTATLTGLGQWTFIQAHATFTPPKVVEGTELAPVTRDQFLFVPPLIIGGGGALAVGATSLVQFARVRGIRLPFGVSA
jgi:hypothetical protein